jgi:hypothetical protein
MSVGCIPDSDVALEPGPRRPAGPLLEPSPEPSAVIVTHLPLAGTCGVSARMVANSIAQIKVSSRENDRPLQEIVPRGELRVCHESRLFRITDCLVGKAADFRYVALQ